VELDYLFGECHESARAYGIPKHRHLSEIEEQLSLAAGEPVVVQFTPHLIPIHRGILTTLYLEPARPAGQGKEMAALGEEIEGCFQAAYGAEPFVRLLDGKTLPDTKSVAGSNVIEIAWRLDGRTGRLIVLSAIDNITKGASGQAVQSMNILRGFPETAGLC
jgi:N-acetyl-gamma-glutamyl-phosphate reductase